MKQGGRYFLLHHNIRQDFVKQKVPSPSLHWIDKKNRLSVSDNLLRVYKTVMLPLTFKDNLMVMN